MIETEFEKQEHLRNLTERRKEASKTGTPMPGSVEEFIDIILPHLSESKLLREYVRREHAENKSNLESMRRYYERRLEEQDLAIDGLKAEVATLRLDFTEFKDNFNLFTSKLLAQSETRLKLVQKAVSAIDDAIR